MPFTPLLYYFGIVAAFNANLPAEFRQTEPLPSVTMLLFRASSHTTVMLHPLTTLKRTPYTHKSTQSVKPEHCQL